jgi:hypothetical protein
MYYSKYSKMAGSHKCNIQMYLNPLKYPPEIADLHDVLPPKYGPSKIYSPSMSEMENCLILRTYLSTMTGASKNVIQGWLVQRWGTVVSNLN